MNKVLSRTFSGILGAVFLVTQHSILASGLSNLKTTSNPIESEFVGEVIERREECVKHFRKRDGSMTAVLFSEPIHYKVNNKFEEIDNSFVEKNYEYENTASPLKVRMSKDFNNKKLVTINVDGYEIFCSYIKKDKNQAMDKSAEPKAEIENFKNKTRKFKNKKHELTDVSKCTAKSKYKNIEQDVDFDYTLSGLSLKENIILNKKLDGFDSFDFEFKTDLKIEKDKSGDLNFKDKSGKTVMTMPHGVMWDSAENFSNNVDYKFEKTKEGYIISVVPDKKWLESAVYPCTIDPSMKLPSSTVSIIDTHAKEIDPNTNCAGIDHLPVGRETAGNDCVSYIKLGNMPSFINGEIITDANLKLHYYGHLANQNNCILAKKVTTPWEISGPNALTWNNRPSVEHQLAPGTPRYQFVLDNLPPPEVVDYININDYNTYSLDLTRLIKEAYYQDNPNNNNGIALSSRLSENNQNGLAKFISTHSLALPNNKPTLEIEYRNFIGEEPYWSYTKHSAGLKGTGKVNNYAGTFSLSENILSYSGARNPLHITNTYNNSNYNEHANTTLQEEKFINGFKHSSSTGHGWSLNFNQMIYQLPTNDPMYLPQGGNFRYLYVDYDGTWHYFYLKDNTLIDEDGLGFKINEITATKLEMIDKNGNKSIFENKEPLNTINPCFVLISSEDANQNKTVYEYTSQANASGNLKVSKITEVLDNTLGTGRETYIEYGIHRMVSKITNADSKEINFTYNGQKLTEIQYPDESGKELKTCYEYDAQGRLCKAWTNFGKSGSVEYTYVSNETSNSGFFKIKSVKEYCGEDNDLHSLANTVNFDYGVNQTKITNRIGVLKSENIEIWQFDHDGRVTSVTDKNGNMITQKHENDREKDWDNQNYKSACTYKVKHANDTGKYANNLLKNPDARHGMDSWETGNRGEESEESGEGWSVGASKDTYNIGTQSFKISQTCDSFPYLKQIVPGGHPLDSIKYTLSAYVKIDGTLEGSGKGARLQLAGYDNDKPEDNFYSEPIYTTNSEWRKISVTYEAPRGGYQVCCYASLSGSIGTAYFDCFQLETGNVANDYNMVENSSFDCNLDSWTPVNLDSNVNDGIDTGKECLKITGDSNLEKYVYQDISINKQDAVLAVRAHAKGVAAPQQGALQYHVRCLLTFEDNFQTHADIPFNPDVYDWQWAYGSIVANNYHYGKKLKSVRVQPSFNYNCNTVYFDDIQVCIDDQGITYERDADGDIIKIIYNTGLVTEIERDSISKEVTKVKSLNNLTKNTYYSQNNHRLISSSSALDKCRSIHKSFKYDEFGNIVKTKLKGCCGCQRFIETTSTFSPSGNYIIESTDSSGNITEYEYDSEDNGLLSKVITPNGAEIEYEYDEAGRIKSVCCSDSKIEYSYKNGILSDILHGINSGVNVAYNFAYNIFGKIIQSKIGKEVLRTNSYNYENNLLCYALYGNLDSIHYDYDNLGRLSKKYSFDSGYGSFKYLYDNQNRIMKISGSRNDQITHFDYDMYGRLIHIRSIDGVEKDYSYTKNNLVIDKKLKFGEINQATYNAYIPGDRLRGSTIKTNGIDFCSDYLKYDHIGRKIHLAMGSSANSNAGLIKHWKYVDVGNDKTTMLIKDVTYKLRQNGSYSANPDLKFSYEYDNMNNISRIFENETLKVEYFYDEQNQLKRENNGYLNKTIVYEYDFGGNIQNKSSYALTLGNESSDLSLLTPTTITYGYSDSNWKDKMTAYNGQNIKNDSIGNPIEYKDGWKFKWIAGRQLKIAKNSNLNIATGYEYDENGIRTQKTVNGVKTDFVTDGSQILAQKTGDNTLVWQIDGTGEALGFIYNGEQYYYLKNAGNDIVAIADKNSEIVAKYTYDSWGKLVSIKDENDIDVTNEKTHIGYINPLRFRGYYYDCETSFYYLNSRYYDSETGRFLNADDENILLKKDNSILDYNLFTYFKNNPVNSVFINELRALLPKNSIDSKFESSWKSLL